MAGGPRRFSDDFDNERFVAWHKHRCQCRFRKEAYDLSLEDWFSIWPKHLWHQRGRGRKDLCLVRKDTSLPWSVANCEIIERIEQLRRSAFLRKRKIRYRKWI